MKFGNLYKGIPSRVERASSKVEEIYRHCKVPKIYEGTNEIQELIIAREIFGRELTA